MGGWRRTTPAGKISHSCATGATLVVRPRRPETVLHRIARGSALGDSHCADHKPLNPEPSQPSAFKLPQWPSTVCKHRAHRAWKRAWRGPARADHHVAGLGVPSARHLGLWQEKRLRAMRGGGQAFRGGHSRSRPRRSRLCSGKSVQVTERGKASKPGGKDGLELSSQAAMTWLPCRSRPRLERPSRSRRGT